MQVASFFGIRVNGYSPAKSLNVRASSARLRSSPSALPAASAAREADSSLLAALINTSGFPVSRRLLNLLATLAFMPPDRTSWST